MRSMAASPPAAPAGQSPAKPTTPGAPGANERTGLQTILSLLPFLWPPGDVASHTRTVIAVTFLVLAKATNVLVPLAYAAAVDALTPANLPGGTALIVIPAALILGYGLLRVSASFFGEFRDAIFSTVQQRAARTVALDTFTHLHRLSLRFHLDRQTGGLSRAIERGTVGIQTVLRLAVFNVLPTLLEVSLVTAIIWTMFDWRFALATGVAIAGYLTFTVTYSAYRVRVRRTMNESDSEAQTKAVDSLLNYETVKYFGNEPHEQARFDLALARYEKAAVKNQVSLNMLNLGQAAIIATGLTVVMTLAAQGVQDGSMSVGRFVMVNTYLMQIYQPLNMLGFVYREIKQGLIDMEAMFRLMSLEQEVADQPTARPLANVKGAVAFEGVRFAYRPDRTILHDVSFHVAPGKSLAIVGSTGAGKSTISRLLFRFYDVTGGRVTIDGQDIRDITQASLRAAIGVVPQDTVLFNDTIRYNIAYGRPGATQAEIEAAAKMAQVHEFVLRLPDGYDTRVGERGLKLSGGEKQRVAIARTILKNPPILILDEATSALDTRTEQDIQTALRELAADRTTVTIAHRLSTVVDADEIIVLDEGMVAERGTHYELLAQGGLYARMWAMQAEATEMVAAK
ncbi:MAG: ABC transporter ATP-binding protein/permease [Alphaproteobacteria bacterium]|nr:ABC transporter ATP-binding protein/permease [Alphaproteobacteria bacterium]